MNLTKEQRDLFEKLKEDRLDSWKVLNKPSNKGISKSISDKYSDNMHFILELLQNADDTKATIVNIVLFENRLEFTHNGKRRFTISDVTNEEHDHNNGKLGDINSITGIGFSNKDKNKDDDGENEKQKIGKFGIGFKSVFQICNEIEIYDNPFSFKIKNFIIPELIENSDIVNKDKTTFIFHFRSKEIYQNIFEKLNTLTEHLYFLNNINEFTWKFENKEGIYIKQIFDNNLSLICEYKENNQKNLEKSIEEEFLYFSKEVKIPYEFENEKFTEINCKCIILIPENQDKKHKPYCFFPLIGEEGNYGFIFHSPFLLINSREKIDFSNDQNTKFNINLIDTLSELLCEILEYLSNNERLTYKEWLQFPINDKEDNKIYELFFGKIKEFVSDENNYLIPSNKPEEFLNKKEAVFAGNNTLIDLFPSNGIFWVDKNITEKDETNLLYNFFKKNVGIKLRNVIDILNNLNEEVLFDQTNEWLIQFYNLINDQKQFIKEELELSKNLNTKSFFIKKKIIKLNTGEFVAPFDEKGNLNCFFPSDFDTKVNTIDKDLYENVDSKEFFTKIGIKEFDILEEVIVNVIPIYEKTPLTINKEDNYEHNYEHNKKIVQALNESKDHDRTELVTKLKSLKFIAVINRKTNERIYEIPKNVYLSEKYTQKREIESFFEDIEDFNYFLIDDIYSDLYNVKTLKDLEFKDKIDLKNECKQRIIDKYYSDYKNEKLKDIKNNLHLKHLNYIIKSKEQELIEVFKFKSININGKIEWEIGEKSYIRTKELETLFGNDFCFIDEELYKQYLVQIIKLFSINDKLKIEIDKYIIEKITSQGVNYSIIDYDPDYDWRGLDNFNIYSEIENLDLILKQPSAKKFSIIFKYIFKYINNISGQVQWKELNAINFQKKNQQLNYSTFGNELLSNAWIPDNNGEYKKPNDINLSDIPDDLIDKNSHETKLLCDKLGIKYSNISEEDRKKVLKEAGIENEEQFENLKLLAKLPQDYIQQISREYNKKQENLDHLNDIQEPFDENKRAEKNKENVVNTSGKVFESKSISTKVSDNQKEVSQMYLEANYKINVEIICQICNNNMPYKFKNEDYYEIVLLLNLSKDYPENYLCLCPNCSSLFTNMKKEVNFNEYLKSQINNLDFVKDKNNIINLSYFNFKKVETVNKSILLTYQHIFDIKHILEVEEENKLE